MPQSAPHSISPSTARNQRWLAKRPDYYAEWYAKHPGYASWKAMVQRCTNPSAPNWSRYGGRGITLCTRWRESYNAFIEDAGTPPGPGYSIDRIDANGNYEPGNVRWATASEQQRNKRSKITEEMKEYLMARSLGDSWQTIADRMNADGVRTPLGRVWSRQNAKDAAVRAALPLFEP